MNTSKGYASAILSNDVMEQLLPPLTSLPNSVDLREWGIMGPALDQGSCGSCWAMSTRYIANALFVHDLPEWTEIYGDEVVNLTALTTRFSV